MIKINISEFEWNNGNWPKCGKHGVSKSEIEYILLNTPMVMHDPYVNENRLRAIGKTKHGRYVFLVFMLRDSISGTKIRPISARYMHKKEVEHYENTFKKITTIK